MTHIILFAMLSLPRASEYLATVIQQIVIDLANTAEVKLLSGLILR